MAKHCTNCGHELQGTEKFCAECGTPLGGVTVQATQTKWESCQIEVKKLKNGFWSPLYFPCILIATAIGPAGPYMAAESGVKLPGLRAEYSEYQYIEAKSRAVWACNALVQRLIADGWEPTERGSDWWNYKFRRPVKG